MLQGCLLQLCCSWLLGQDGDCWICPVAGCAGQQQFYADLYGVTSDPHKALHVLLDKKEAFSQQICNGLMSRLLGMQYNFPACAASSCQSQDHPNIQSSVCACANPA